MCSIKVAIVLLAIAVICVTTTFANETSENTPEEAKILSRRRRYLIFPSGSSFQVVYDGIYPIVGWTTLFILGVTCALAWQLPSEPVNLRELSAKLHADDNKDAMAEKAAADASKADKDVTKIAYVDTKSNYGYGGKVNFDRNDFTAPIYYSDSGPVQSNKYHTYYNRTPVQGLNKTYYPSSNKNYYSTASRPYYSKQPQFSHNNFNDDLLSTISKFTHNPQSQKPWKNADWTQIADTFSKLKPALYTDRKGVRHHMIYPQIGKRSIHQPDLSVDDKLFMHHHRNTRHELYAKMSKFLDVQGMDGKQCILKTICETSEKRHEVEPGSFLSEIFRAIFSFPKPHYRVDDPDHIGYDAAHATGTNCSQTYSKCQLNIWNENWML